MSNTLDLSSVRSKFPALASGFIFADNAGGSQVSKVVIDKLSDYLSYTNVQLGADYSVSAESTSRVASGSVSAADLFNAASPDEIVFGASSTLNLENLARGLEPDIQPGDEIIVTGEHEANAGPWKKLAKRRDLIVKYWHATPTSPNNPYSIKHKIEELVPLITEKTRIVAFTACSNILGTIVPVKEAVQAIRAAARERGAKKIEISVDCVAYAPHRKIDVQDWDVDFAVVSLYKVYGPHLSALYVRASVLKSSITALTHHFLDVSEISYKLQPGGPGYELVYASTGILDYLLSLTPSKSLEASFAAIANHEQNLIEPLLNFLTAEEQVKRGIRVVGDEKAGDTRVPTISFVVVGERAKKSKDLVVHFDKRGGVGIRYGHFYAYTVVDTLVPKLDVADGVVRISLVHYNTVEEVQKIIEILKEILA